MKKYILFRRYRGKTLQDQEVNLPATTPCICVENIIVTLEEHPRIICAHTSQVSHEYFALDEDNNGLERGNLTYAIAFKNRTRYNNEGTRRQRFTDAEIEMLETEYSQYLIKGIDVILFNQSFFDADIDTLRQLAAKLNIKGGKS